jgi:hypothetical protein
VAEQLHGVAVTRSTSHQYYKKTCEMKKKPLGAAHKGLLLISVKRRVCPDGPECSRTRGYKSSKPEQL